MTGRIVQTMLSAGFRHPWRILAACLFLVLLAASGAQRLQPASDYRDFFQADNEQLRAYESLRRHYTNDDNILIVLEPARGTIFDAEYLRAVSEATEAAWKLPFVIRVDSIANYQHTTAEGDELLVGDLVDASRLGPADIEKLRSVALHEPELLKRLIDPGGERSAINLSVLLPGKDPLRETPQLVSAARALATQIHREHPDIRVYLTGVIMLNNAFAEVSQVDMITLMPMVFLIVLSLVALFLRSLRAMLMTFIVMLFSILLAMGCAGYLGYPMTPPLAAVPIILMTLAVAHCVHLLLPALRELERGRSQREALAYSLRVNTRPVLITSVTTALGFLSLNFAEVLPFHHLGNTAALGVMTTFLFALLLLPALARLMPLKRTARSILLHRLTEALADFVLNRRRVLLPVMLALSALAISFIPTNRIDETLIDYFHPSLAFRQHADYVDQHLSGAGFIDYSLPATQDSGVSQPEFLRSVENFVEWLEVQPEVVHVHSITRTFKRLNRNLHEDKDDWYRLPEQADLAAQYLLLYEMSLPFGLDLNNQVNFDKSATRITASVRKATAQEYIALDLRAQAWLSENAPMLATIGASPTMMFSHISMNNAVSMLRGTSLALIGISLILILALGSVRIGVMSLVPNLLPIAVAFGTWGILNGEIGLGLSLVAATALGIIVDDTVHFLSKYLRGRRHHGLAPDASIRYAFDRVGAALLTTSIALASGFVMLGSSVFKLNSDMGTLTAATIVIALIFDFLLLPLLILLFDRASRTTGLEAAMRE